MSTIVKEPVQPMQHLIWDVKVDKPHPNGNGFLEEGEKSATWLDQTPQSKAGMRVSEAEYWEIYYDDSDFHYEWNNSILEEKPVSSIRGAKQLRWAGGTLESFIQTYPVAQIVSLEIGFRMEVKGETAIRKPDLFVVCNDNPIPAHDDDLTYAGTCDICIEALSSSRQSEITRDVKTKKGEYEGAGVREYYILDPEGEHTAFYRQNEQGKYEDIPIADDGIFRSTVLPGFQFRVSDLYRLPSLLEMANDEVYRHFVMPAYHQEKERANQAEAQAEQERLARSEAEAQAEQERLARSEAEAQAEQERLARSKAEAQAEQERLARSEAKAQAEQERLARSEAEAQAEQERQRAEEADARAAEANVRAEQERLRAERLEAQLRALGLLNTE